MKHIIKDKNQRKLLVVFRFFVFNLEKDFRNLITSPLLRGDKKINILNQYVYPKLIYPLQTTPIDLLPPAFLERVDVLIR